MTVVCTENLNSYVMVMKSYWQVQPKFDTSHARSLYNDHFGPVEGPLIYDTLATYFKDSLRLTMWAALASGIVFFCVCNAAFAGALRFAPYCGCVAFHSRPPISR